MFDGDMNVHLDREHLKIHYSDIIVIRLVEHTVSLFFIHVSKTTVVNKMITAQKAIYNLFGSGIYYKPHPMFK